MKYVYAIAALAAVVRADDWGWTSTTPTPSPTPTTTPTPWSATSTSTTTTSSSSSSTGWGETTSSTVSVWSTWTTEVVTALTTYCPEATKITHGGKTYTVSSATTLTITDCPCTLTKPWWTTVTSDCSTSAEPVSTGWGETWTSVSVAPVSTAAVWTSSVAVAPVSSSSVWVASYSPGPSIAPYTGGAAAMAGSVGAGLVGVAGVAAMLL